MTNALHDMKDAPRDERVFAWKKDFHQPDMGLWGWRIPQWNDHSQAWSWEGWSDDSDYFDGYLPLPADASSREVAETAGKWLSRCEVVDQIRAIETMFENLPPDAMYSLGMGLSRFAAHKAAQEPTDD